MLRLIDEGSLRLGLIDIGHLTTVAAETIMKHVVSSVRIIGETGIVRWRQGGVTTTFAEWIARQIGWPDPHNKRLVESTMCIIPLGLAQEVLQVWENRYVKVKYLIDRNVLDDLQRVYGKGE